MKNFLLFLILTTIVLPQAPHQLLQEKNKEKWEKKAQEKALSKDYLSTIVYQPELKPNWNSELEEFKYTDVIQVEDILKEQLYDAILDWTILKLKTEGQTIQINDKEIGRIVARGELENIGLGFSDNTEKNFGVFQQVYRNYTYPFLLDIKLKDGRFKYDLKIISYKVDTTLNITDPLFTGEISSKKTEGMETPFTNMAFNQYSITDKQFGVDHYSNVDAAVKNLLEDLKLYISTKDFNEEDW
jgi:hypothetical protein